MNLKRILSAVVAFGVITSSVPVFAAEVNHIELGTPYDVTTGEYTSDLVAGHVIGIPVNISSATNKVENYSLALDYDPNILIPGVLDSNLTNDQYADLENFGAIETQASGMDYNVNGFYTTGRGGNTAIASSTINSEYVTSLGNSNMKGFFISWFYSVGQDITENPENMLLFTVNSTTDELNAKIFELDLSRCLVNDSTSNNFSGEATKANACDGAFKVVVDSEALPYWVQGVTANIGDQDYALDAALNEDGTTSYSFPVRVTSAAEEASVDATIKATVSDDEAGSANLREVEWGTVTVDMTGTVTDYAQANASIN